MYFLTTTYFKVTKLCAQVSFNIWILRVTMWLLLFCSVQYLWEKKEKESWTGIAAVPGTCVLYAKCCGTYKCTVDGEAHFFEVQGKVQLNVVY